MKRRLVPVVLAATAVAGAGAIVVPQHAASLAALAAGVVVVVFALFLLVLAGPLVTAAPPTTALDRGVPVRRVPGLDPQGLRDARRDLTGRHGPGALPPAVWERLVVATVLRLQRCGIDIDAPATREQGRALLRPATWALLVTPPTPGSAIEPERAAAIVHRTLDELDALVAPHGGHP